MSSRALNPELSTDYDGVSTINSAALTTAPREVFWVFQDRLYAWTSDNKISEVSVTITDGTPLLSVSPIFAASSVFSGAVWQGKLWIATTESSGTVYSWDGSTLLTSTTTAGAGTLILAPYKETLLVFGTHSCKKYDGSTWSTVTMATTTTSFLTRCQVTYKNTLYVGGVDQGGGTSTGKILSWDGTTMTLVNTCDADGTTAANDKAGCWSLQEFNGFLYYGHGNGKAATSTFKVGKFDGVSTWTNAHKDLGSQLSITTAVQIPSMEVFGGSLYAGLVDTYVAIFKSAGSTTDGVWTAVIAHPATINPYDMLVF
jgi:hypothetical protein